MQRTLEWLSSLLQNAFPSGPPCATPQQIDDFVKALAKNKKAKAFLATLNRANTYAIAFRLHHAKKPETRARRIETFIAKLAEETPIV